MHLKSLAITNFRAIHDLTVTFDSLVNVIVGPNAIGKTTILEAIRFAKGVLAPRTVNEAMQVMIALGFRSPHLPQNVFFEAVARDKTRPLRIWLQFTLSNAQVGKIAESVPNVAYELVQAQIGQALGNPAAVIQFMSSPQGKSALESAVKALGEFAEKLKIDPILSLDLNIDQFGNARGADQLAQVVASVLDRDLSPTKTLFSYFPADRVMPAGEPGIQIGAADAAQQLESHNSTPQNKYVRLKNTVFNLIVSGSDGRSRLEHEFERIFASVLKGRRLHSVGTSDRGVLSIKVADTATGRTFDVDAMSSGEKGLILTFLLISQSMEQDGLLLIDEPELHLNPAVCKDVLGFLVREYAIPRNLQAIVCTHSPEILAGALDLDSCSLYHLRSDTQVTKVRTRDETEVASALQRLGSSQSEVLLYRGTIFVEGPEDVNLLETGFENILSRYKLKELGGRGEVENQIRRLQEAEARGEDVPITSFVFDLDRTPSMLASTDRVKIIQWRRRMIENYLLDVETLTDLLTDFEYVATPLQNMGEVTSLLQELATSQLLDIAAREIYEEHSYTSPGLRRSEVVYKSLDQITDLLYDRLHTIKNEVSGLDETSWKTAFRSAVKAREAEKKVTWQTSWIDLCDGKRLFVDLQKKIHLKVSLSRFKRQIMLRMRIQQRDPWVLMNALLTPAVTESITQS